MLLFAAPLNDELDPSAGCSVLDPLAGRPTGTAGDFPSTCLHPPPCGCRPVHGDTAHLRPSPQPAADAPGLAEGQVRMILISDLSDPCATLPWVQSTLRTAASAARRRPPFAMSRTAVPALRPTGHPARVSAHCCARSYPSGSATRHRVSGLDVGAGAAMTRVADPQTNGRRA